jgi:hypothetical protein
MRIFLIFVIVALLDLRLFADIAPDNSGTILFKVCTMTPTNVRTGDPAQSSKPTFIIDSKNPLLMVSTLRDLRLEPDALAVRVILNDSDAKVLSLVTHKYPLLAFVGGDDKTTVLIKIAEPVDDGSMLFANAHYTGAMAAYLRSRFHIKPNSNQAETPPFQIQVSENVDAKPGAPTNSAATSTVVPQPRSVSP